MIKVIAAVAALIIVGSMGFFSGIYYVADQCDLHGYFSFRKEPRAYDSFFFCRPIVGDKL
jgi:hypothetical protein